MNKKIKKDEDGLSYQPSLFNRDLEKNIIIDYVENNFPAVNIIETKMEYIIELSAPGFEKEDISIHVDKDIMTIAAKVENSVDDDDRKEKILRHEFCSTSFSRSFTLPEHIDTERIKAEEKHGLLIINLPKDYDAVADKVRKIDIN